ncbi:YihY/virulence factor BrkB family protein [Polluticoccus soli]|uniref:YihY/virulence factor BrkB family protein n=1 Tax=Polluticoccus soli TaxID=3034150 RepID=UPI0023E0A681|nr:YihY/virulence factor BrkB family protein [Flavipsychrobacter sp. JY13-12]
MTVLQQYVRQSRPVRVVRDRAKKIIVPGTEGLSLYEVTKFFLQGIRNSRLNVSCAAVTYNFLMAIPPTLLFLFSLVPYLPLHDVQNTILMVLRYITPNVNAYNNISGIIVDFMNNTQEGVLSFGLLLTIFFSSNGMMGLIRNFEKSLPFYVKRSGLRKRWTAIKLTFMLMGVVILTLAALIIQSQELNEIILQVFDNTLVPRLVSLLIIGLLIFSSISVVYTYGPSLNDRFDFVSPGSVFATILCIITTFVFYFLVNNFINYSKVYGSIGSIMAFMVWMWLNTMVILLGYELNVSIMLAQTSKNDVPEAQV